MVHVLTRQTNSICHGLQFDAIIVTELSELQAKENYYALQNMCMYKPRPRPRPRPNIKYIDLYWQVIVTLVHLDLSMEVQCLKDVLRYVIEIVGEQSAMTVGVMPMLKLFVDSLDSQLLVSLLSVVDSVYNYFLYCCKP